MAGGERPTGPVVWHEACVAFGNAPDRWGAASPSM